MKRSELKFTVMIRERENKEKDREIGREGEKRETTMDKERERKNRKLQNNCSFIFNVEQ